MGSPTQSIRVTVDPVSKPVTVAEVKNNFAIDIDEDDYLIDQLIHSAVKIIETETNHHMCERTLEWRFKQAEGDEIELPFAPVQSISSITYVDDQEVEQTIAASVYELDQGTTPPMIRLKYNQAWPYARGGAIDYKVTFVTGYAGTADSPLNLTNLPEALRRAIIMMVGGVYKNPESHTLDIRVFRAHPMVQFLIGPYTHFRPIIT